MNEAIAECPQPPGPNLRPVGRPAPVRLSRRTMAGGRLAPPARPVGSGGRQADGSPPWAHNWAYLPIFFSIPFAQIMTWRKSLWVPIVVHILVNFGLTDAVVTALKGLFR